MSETSYARVRSGQMAVEELRSWEALYGLLDSSSGSGSSSGLDSSPGSDSDSDGRSS